MYVDTSACIRVNDGESEWFRTRVYHVLLAVQCIYGWSDEGGEDGNGKEGYEIPGG